MKFRTTNPLIIFSMFAVQIAITAWSIYLMIKIAQHVNAWPF